MAVVTDQELDNFSQLLGDTSPKGEEVVSNEITESELLAFENSLGPLPEPEEPSTISFQLIENLTKDRAIDWTKDRIAEEKKTLGNIVNPFGFQGLLKPIPQMTSQQDAQLDTWWRDQGQFIPRSILTDMGIQGGVAVPTTEQLERLESVRRVEDLKAALNLTPDITEDPLAALTTEALERIGEEKPEPSLDVAQQLIKNASLEDAEAVLDIMQSNILDFPPELIEFTRREIEIKKTIPKAIEAIGITPFVVIWGTDFFNILAGNLPAFTSRKGLNPIENIAAALGVPIESEDVWQAAIGRVREMIVAEDPRLTTRLALGLGGIAADLIKFVLLPDPSKLKVFAKLSPAVKAAIGVGSRAGLVELLQAPKEGETIEERAKTVSIATGVGALTGAVFTKLSEAARAVFTKIKDLPVARQADEILLNNPDIGLSKQETIAVLKNLKSTNPEQFKIAISGQKAVAKKVVSRIVEPTKALPAGFRPGFAEIQKPGEFAKKVIQKGAPKVKGPAAVVAAKALPVKAVPVKPVKPTKILTKSEALSFQESNLVTGEGDKIRIVADEKSRRLIQGSEKEIAKLKTQKAQLQADKKVALAKVKAVEIAKREGVVDKLRERLGIKLETTIEGAKAKINKINQATEFKEGLRKDAISMIQAVPKDLRADFIVRANKIGLQSQRPETALKALRKLTEQISVGVDRAEQRIVINRIKTEIPKIEKKYRRGVERLGRLPEPQRTQVMELIDSTDFKKLTDPKEADLVSLQRHVKKLSAQLAGNIEALDADVEDALKLPSGRVQELLRLSQKKVADMDLDDLIFFEQSLTNLIHNASLKKSLLVKGGLKPIEGALKEISGEIKPTRRAIKEAGKEVKRPERTALQKTVDVAKRLTILDDSHLDTLVELSTANQRDATRQILDTDLHEGQRKTAIVIWDSVVKSADAFEKIGFTQLKQLETKRVITLAGQKIEIEEDFLVKLEMHMRSPDNLKAILKTKGWTIEGKDFDYPEDIDRMAELQEIRTKLPEMSKGIADWTKKLNIEVLRPAVNETALVSQGHELARDDNYTSRPRSLPQRVEGGKGDISVPPEQKGRFLPRTGGTARIRLERWSTDFLDSIESEAFFHGMTVPLRNARIIASSDSFQTDMKAAGRQLELNNIITILRRTQGIASSKSLLDVLGSKILRGFTSAALGFRVSTRGTQVMSFWAAQAETGFRPGAIFKPHQPSWIGERITEDSALMALRERGMRIGAEIGANAALDTFDLLFFDKSPRITQKGFRGITKGDTLARDNIYQELVVPEILQKVRNGKNVDPLEWEGREVADLPAMTDPDSKAFRYAAARRLEYVFRRTQPMFDILDRSVTLSDPRVWQRSLFIFRTALEAQENIVQRSINQYAGSSKTRADKLALTGAIMAVVVSATAVAIWKRAFKWARETAAKTALAAFGVFGFRDKKQADEIASTVASDTFKNLARLNKVGKFAVDFAEQAAATFTGDGYNWNRETFELPILDVLQSGSEAGVALTQSIVDLGKLDEFVEEVTTLDKAFNEQLEKEIASDMRNAIGSSFEFGVRISGVPLLAPFQEFIKPFLRDSRIKLIREITFDDVEKPNEYAQRIHDIFEERTELNRKAKSKRLTSEGDSLQKALNVFVSKANRAADIIKQTPDQEARKRAFVIFERNMATIEQQIKEFNQ